MLSTEELRQKADSIKAKVKLDMDRTYNKGVKDGLDFATDLVIQASASGPDSMGYIDIMDILIDAKHEKTILVPKEGIGL